jgi:ribonuclease R
MIVHRLVARYLLGDRHEKVPENLEQMAEHCSDTEQQAVMAERDSVKQMQALWISKHLGEEAEGYISSVTDFGIFVTLNHSHCDGLIHLHTISPGHFLDYEPDNFRIVVYDSRSCRRRSSQPPLKTYTLGDNVRVRIIRADVEKRQIDFQLIE